MTKDSPLSEFLLCQERHIFITYIPNFGFVGFLAEGESGQPKHIWKMTVETVYICAEYIF